MDLQERGLHLCFCFIVSQIVCAHMYTTHHYKERLTSLRKSVLVSQKCLLLVVENWSPRAALFPPQEHAGSPRGAVPAQTHIAVPTATLHLPSLCFLGHSSELRTRSSAIMIQLPRSATTHGPLKCLQLLALPAWLLVPLQSRASSSCRRETSSWLSSPPAPCAGSCSPASRESHWKEMLKLVSCSASQFIPQTRHLLLLILPLS